MAVYELEHNGRMFEVEAPDINSALAAFGQGQQPGHEQAAVQDAFSAAAQRMQRPHMRTAMGPAPETNLTMGDIDNGVRQLAKGTLGIGSYMDEIAAAGDAATYPVFGRGAAGESYGQRYEQNIAAERQRDKSFEAANPAMSTALQVGGGVASGGALMKAAPGAARAVMGSMPGASLPARMIAGAGAGAGVGAVHGFGAGENGFQERLGEAARGGVIGGGVGALIPGVATVGQRMAGALSNWRAGSEVAQDLGVPRGAVNRVAQSLERDQFTPAMAAARSVELGPDGMVLDMGRQLQGRAEAVASLPGSGQNKVIDAVEGRVRETAQRMGADLDRELGSSPDIVALAGKIDQHYRPLIRPAYESVMTAHPTVWDDTLQRLTRRASVRKAADDAVTLAGEMGDEIASPFARAADGSLRLRPNVTPNLAYWDYVKKSLDGRIGAMTRNPDPDSAGKQTVSALIDTRRELVEHLDRLTDGAYRKARNLAADRFAVHEALENGLEIFKNKMLPEQFREAIADLGPVERTTMAAGARRALERLREVAPANMSEGGRQVYRELLQGGPDGDTAQKLRMLLGKEPADRLIAAARRETEFQDAYARIATNSRTAPRLAAMEDMQPMQAPETLTGGINRAMALPVTGFINSRLRQGNEQTREGIADLLTRKGATRDMTVQALMGLNNTRAAGLDTSTRDTMAALLMGPSIQQAQKLPVMEDRRPLVRKIFGNRQ